MSNRRRVLTVLVDRANYGRLKPVMAAIARHPELELLTVCAGTMVLKRFDRPVDLVRADGFAVHGEVYVELEGSVPSTMAKSVGFATIEFASEFQKHAPDVVLLIGDRYEALGAALAAAYMNIPIVHIQGGEVSGSIDESARHAITKLAQFHYPATRRAAEYIVRMGERPDTILGVGCPSSDLAKDVPRPTSAVINGRGAGCQIDVDAPYLLCVFHPTTTEFGGEREQMDKLLEALERVAKPTVMLWPNIDAGSDELSKSIRVFRSHRAASWLRTITNLSPEDYLSVLAHASCAIGNSSSFVRDAGFLGTPIVLCGNRQNGRETDVHVKRVPVTVDAVANTIQAQLEHGRYAPSSLYGDGHVAQRIADAVAALKPYVQKRLAYIDELPEQR